MKNLELKHLAPYLPYGLTFYWESLDGSDKKNPWVLKPENIAFAIDMQNKPILHPLSNLTKEIEINGKKFIPAEILFSVENDELQDFKDFGKIPEYWQDAIKVKPRWFDYYQVEFLFEWHFDVFGLIDKDLAIDINTLKK